ncbi:MAG: tRNA (adenosine(37)-N6)-dimethylallyltransferase MiaA, partial [Patescibacteria group bacterium]
MSIQKPKLITILGPTASGKSDLAVKLAKEFNGEIISADSRQLYKEMNIGTGKITKKEMKGIKHYLLDISTPKKQITITEFKEKAEKAIKEIYKKNKIPILCGGTGFYIQAITENIIIPRVKPDKNLRKELEKKTIKQLFEQLKKLDPKRSKSI